MLQYTGYAMQEEQEKGRVLVCVGRRRRNEAGLRAVFQAWASRLSSQRQDIYMDRQQHHITHGAKHRSQDRIV